MQTLLERLSLWFALAGGALAAIVAAMTATSIAGRATIAKPIPGDVELTQFGIAVCITLCLPWCQLRGANIIVDFFTQKATPRVRAGLDGFGALLLALMCALLSWRSAAGAIAVRAAGEQTMILGLPMWWTYALLAPGLALTAVVALWQATRHGRGLDARATPP